MIFAILNILVALFLGYGAVEEFWVRGVGGGEVQPLVVGLAGVFVSILLALSGVGLWRRWPNARTLAVAAVLSIVFHVYAACPPHRNVGILVLLVGAGYGLLLLSGIALIPGERKARTA
jgi:hypothetical protein